MRMKVARLAASLLVAFGIYSSAHSEEPTVERGSYLISIGICRSCHTDTLAGGRTIAGVLTPNITPDVAAGIGSWSEAQIVDAMRNGHRPDGSSIRPPMGIWFYRNLSDTDVKSIAAFLKSIPAVATTFARQIDTTYVADYGPAVSVVPEPDKKDRLGYGAYIAKTVSHCMQCHTPATKGRPDLARIGSGGNGYTAPDGRAAVSSNLTPSNTDGIVKWTDEQIKTSITTGIRPDGSAMVPVMNFPAYSRMTNEDLDAVVLFLRTLKPIQP